MRLALDKVASCTRNVPIPRDARISPQIIASEGYIVAGRLHGHKSTYNQLEDIHGRLLPLHDGDLIAGVLGPRNALQGYAGIVPERINVGDRLHLLNLGGVVGQCTSVNPELGRPFDFEVLGSVLVFPDFGDRSGVPAHIRMNAIESDFRSGLPFPPVIFIAGTCMNSGKTSAASRLIRELSQRGMRVGGCKLTGVSLRRDTLQMMDYGAKHAASFTDAGVVTTTPGCAPDVARTLLAHLAECEVDVVVAELGDGIAGEYGVQEILADADLRGLCSVFLLCASDPVGAWGAQRLLHDQHGITIDLVSGPVTDNAVGTRYISGTLGLAALNARTHAKELGEFVVARLQQLASTRAAG